MHHNAFLICFYHVSVIKKKKKKGGRTRPTSAVINSHWCNLPIGRSALCRLGRGQAAQTLWLTAEVQIQTSRLIDVISGKYECRENKTCEEHKMGLTEPSNAVYLAPLHRDRTEQLEPACQPAAQNQRDESECDTCCPGGATAARSSIKIQTVPVKNGSDQFFFPTWNDA